MSLDLLLKRLPSHYKKTPDSNNYKALSLVAKHIEENGNLYKTIQKFWDVDQAEGAGLDRLGKDEGISRGSFDDETYRKMIKIQYIVNMSEGDIVSLNAILTAYMGDGFVNIEEGWDSFLREPASLIINVGKEAGEIPYDLMKRVKSAGVRIYYAAIIDEVVAIVNAKQYTFPVPYPVTGTFHTAPINGVASRATAEADTKTYSYQVPYPVTGTFYCSEGG
ncbi:hypothetical protein ACFQ38_16140 [Sporosarcina contaminans]|uniref:DUF2612 domain-containing protein n=1 Tax=Sporosarcina contaminans TaxID=633403 RepID=A0ABW3U1V5_9BACL